MILDILNEKDFIAKYTGWKVPNFDFSDGEDFKKYAREISDNLIETMCHHQGIGLAATQCGIDLNVFVTGNPDAPEECSAIFNPKITTWDDELTTAEEGCITFPELFLPIERPVSVRMRMQDKNGEVKTETYDGLTARIFQHEYDHLKGINFTHRAKAFHLQRAMKKRKIALRRRKKNAKH